MRKIREILRLRYECGRKHREIAVSVGTSPSTVHSYLRRAAAAGITSWAQAAELSEEAMQSKLFCTPRWCPAHEVRYALDCKHLHTELKRPGVTLLVLWGEYRATAAAAQAKPYSYSQFCDIYREFCSKLRRSMRQVHPAGERAFVDYSGKRPHVVDRATGEVRAVELFVMTLGASSYTYAEASSSQQLPDFCSSLVRGLEFFGGAPAVVVPDQLRSAVRGPDRYDPDINRTLLDCANHYGMTVLPARPRRPKDKAKVEAAVLIVQRWILARIRNETFFSLSELNARIAQLLIELNNKPFQKLDGCRRSLFETLDHPALKPLPTERFDIGLWRKARVHIDYHVSLLDRLYSVPHRYVGKQVEIRFTPSIVEIYLDNDRIASHARHYGPRGSRSADPNHGPASHRAHASWSAERMIAWAQTHGAYVGQAVSKLIASYPQPEFGFRAALGIVRLADQYGSARVDDVCQRAMTMSSLPPRRKFLLALLSELTVAHTTMRSNRTLGHHEHVRGADYFEVTVQPNNKETLH